MDAFNFAKVLSIALLVDLVVSQKNFLGNMVFVNLIRKYIRITGINILFIFFSNNSSSRINFSKVELHSVLDVNIGHGKNVRPPFAFLQACEPSRLFSVMDNMRSFLQKFDAHREELIKFDDRFHNIFVNNLLLKL